MKKAECPHCGLKPLPCPFCGAEALIHGQNMVICTDTNKCGGCMDFGHWCGETDEGVPAEHFVVEQWNKRHNLRTDNQKD